MTFQSNLPTQEFGVRTFLAISHAGHTGVIIPLPSTLSCVGHAAMQCNAAMPFIQRCFFSNPILVHVSHVEMIGLADNSLKPPVHDWNSGALTFCSQETPLNFPPAMSVRYRN